MATRFLLLLLLFSSYLNAQKGSECGFKMSSAQMQAHYAKTQALATLLPHDTCLNRELSLVFHIVLDSMGQPGISLTAIDACIAQLNQVWKPICITFKRCSVNYVPDYNYNSWRDVYDEPTFSSNYYVPNTIDVVLVDSIILPNDAAGYAGTMGHIVMNKSAVGSTTPIHEMGHLFGLPHTFETTGELVRRTSCYTSGDGFCDTEADPYPAGKLTGAHCDFQPGPQDANGDYYTPPLDNYMTYFKGCRCRFTQEQYNFMVYTFLTAGGTQLH